jgi:hypothetical protein
LGFGSFTGSRSIMSQRTDEVMSSNRYPLLTQSGHWRAWSPASWGTWPMTRSWLLCLVSLQDES